MKIEHLLFDLDGTLYPSTAEMTSSFTRGMLLCAADFFGVSYDEAVKLREKNIRNHSTTLAWLRSEGFTDIEGFLAKVHPENETDGLPFDAGLRPLLQSIKLPKTILTNSPREHAERVLKKLNVSDQFEGIVDIRDCGLKGKPYSGAYRIALEKAHGTVENTLFIDDQLKYTDGFIALGGNAVVVGNDNGKHLTEEAKAIMEGKPEKPGMEFHIDSIYDFPELLEKILKI